MSARSIIFLLKAITAHLQTFTSRVSGAYSLMGYTIFALNFPKGVLAYILIAQMTLVWRDVGLIHRTMSVLYVKYVYQLW